MGVESKDELRSPVAGRRILLGITGGIAAYKSAELASMLAQDGALVDAVMTRDAHRFITPLTISALTGRAVHSDLFDPSTQHQVLHIELSHAASIIVVAPATANTIARLAGGFADDLLSAVVLATTAPVLLVPAMETAMWENPATRHNIAVVRERGIRVIGPAIGRLASGAFGPGRMLSPREIHSHLSMLIGENGDLARFKLVVTAGGTREPIDPVRCISNYSSGKMGFAVARAARDRGALVELIATVAPTEELAGVKITTVETAAEMLEAVESAVSDADALVMAAAVADYRPEQRAGQKIKKQEESRQISLVRTADILQQVAMKRLETGFPRFVAGFAAETEELERNAREKLETKQLDLIAANRITDQVFGSDSNRVTIIEAGGAMTRLPRLSKEIVAHEILDRAAPALRRTRSE